MDEKRMTNEEWEQLLLDLALHGFADMCVPKLRDEAVRARKFEKQHADKLHGVHLLLKDIMMAACAWELYTKGLKHFSVKLPVQQPKSPEELLLLIKNSVLSYEKDAMPEYILGMERFLENAMLCLSVIASPEEFNCFSRGIQSSG